MTSCPLSQGHPCPQLFAKRQQTSIGKDVCKDRFADRKREGRWNEKEKKEKERRRKDNTYIVL
jgi:hypothetical protein